MRVGPVVARVALLALAVRGAVAALAFAVVPPADDGRFYDVVARRIAEGRGYTWLWPDGAVTFAAHYPVGYPALLGTLYALFGEHPGLGMLANASLGAAGAGAVAWLALREAGHRAAWVAGVVVACHPALVAYTPALMTEAVTGDLFVVTAALALAALRASRLSARWGGVAFAGALAGFAGLVRPQQLLLVPVLAALLFVNARGRARSAAPALLLVAASSVVLPWTVRNCERLGRCVPVSANGGWNLLIGTHASGKGAWVPIEGDRVPVECREVFDEAAKDACFGRAGVRRVREDPWAWLALVPSKLAATFDVGGAASAYLRAAPAVPETLRVGLAVADTVALRGLGLGAALCAARAVGPWRRVRRALGGLGALCLISPFGAAGWLLVALAMLPLVRRSSVAFLGASALLATALVHSVFFGASRYALVVVPAVGSALALWWTGPGVERSRSPPVPDV